MRGGGVLISARAAAVRPPQAYAMSCCHVQVVLTHVPAAGGPQSIVATSGGGVLRDAIGGVLGAAFAASLVPIAVEFAVPRPAADGAAAAAAAGGAEVRGAARGFVSRMGERRAR
jgi:hypothetical protein